MNASPHAICGKSGPVDFCSLDKCLAVITELTDIDFFNENAEDILRSPINCATRVKPKTSQCPLQSYFDTCCTNLPKAFPGGDAGTHCTVPFYAHRASGCYPTATCQVAS